MPPAFPRRGQAGVLGFASGPPAPPSAGAAPARGTQRHGPGAVLK